MNFKVIKTIDRARSTLSLVQDKNGNTFYRKSFKDVDKSKELKLKKGIINEFICLEFLSGINSLRNIVPQFISSDKEKVSFVMSDVGQGKQVNEILFEDSYESAQGTIKKLMISLAHIHGSTLNRQGQFDQICSSFNHRYIKDDGVEQSLHDYSLYLEKISKKLKIELSSNIENELKEILEVILDPSEFYGFVHWDPCPDNCKVVDGEMKIYDFERSAYANIFVDAAYLLMRFPSCWCVGDIPESLIESGNLVYRETLGSYLPAILDDIAYREQMAIACMFWFLRSTENQFEEALLADRKRGTATIRQRILIRAKVSSGLLSKTGKFENLSNFIHQVYVTLSEKWEIDTKQLDYYPALNSL